MSVEQDPKKLFMAFVDREAARGATRKRSDGYHAVAHQLGLKYDIVYQMYNGQPKSRPRAPSWFTVRDLVRAYQGDNDFDDLTQSAADAFTFALKRSVAVDSGIPSVADGIQGQSFDRETLHGAVTKLAAAIAVLDSTDRKAAAAILHDLAIAPDQSELMYSKLQRLLGGDDPHESLSYKTGT
ncbi:hypothetical protein [Hydrogenophaga sp. ANAO-22]|uniref:hypothetical protein n=1 Tax=Hydrogenophaga sp. ANAO-22 TaxID=3166645 RepID=UPI0036D25159